MGATEEGLVADYRSEQFYGSQEGGSQLGGGDADELTALFPDFPPGSASLLSAHLTPELFAQLAPRTTAMGIGLNDCMISGVEYPESPVGLFAGDAECLVTFGPLFEVGGTPPRPPLSPRSDPLYHWHDH